MAETAQMTEASGVANATDGSGPDGAVGPGPGPGPGVGVEVEGRHVTEPGLTYSRYLRVPELLALQTPSVAEDAEEALFIVTHQVQELWFARLLTELAQARDLMLAGRPRWARSRLGRCLVVDRTLVASLRPLGTLPPHAFHSFRGRLGTASGAQSAQYREIEALCGAPWFRVDRLPPGLTAAERNRLRRRQAEPSLWDAFLHLLRGAGLAVDTRAERAASLARLARGQAPAPEPGEPTEATGPSGAVDLAEVAEVAELLVQHDALWAEWRNAHVLLVERQIGRLPGSGGTSGVPHLRAMLDRRFFPELWEVGDPVTRADATAVG
ncbi:tryptophan 2,3-dioxygenase family protein [Streptomyces sp. 4N509B]|uniref:tryptophan 2,3-dioxygenase family protein n=1 Tax=Streptomyces sp. 4N509B TaxID=3457413 RepID=UPI003FD6A1A2